LYVIPTSTLEPGTPGEAITKELLPDNLPGTFSGDRRKLDIYKHLSYRLIN